MSGLSEGPLGGLPGDVELSYKLNLLLKISKMSRFGKYIKWVESKRFEGLKLRIKSLSRNVLVAVKKKKELRSNKLPILL